tara:strand:- start:372 stop:1460 length:1089 start_codon:yes stop_codon:yes gene_type:complete
VVLLGILLHRLAEEQSLKSGAGMTGVHELDALFVFGQVTNFLQQAGSGIAEDDLGLIFDRDEIIEATLLHEDALVNNAHAVADFLHLFEKVGAEKDGEAPLLEGEDQVADLARADWVHSGSGFVEDEKAWVLHHRLGKSDALKHAFGVASQAAPASGLEVDKIEDLFGALAKLGSAHAAKLAVKANGLFSTQVFVEIGILGEEANVASRIDFGGVLSKDRTLARGGGHEPEQGLHGGGLSGSVGTDQPVDFTGCDFESDAVDCPNDSSSEGATKVLHETTDLDRGRFAHLLKIIAGVGRLATGFEKLAIFLTIENLGGVLSWERIFVRRHVTVAMQTILGVWVTQLVLSRSATWLSDSEGRD